MCAWAPAGMGQGSHRERGGGAGGEVHLAQKDLAAGPHRLRRRPSHSPSVYLEALI